MGDEKVLERPVWDAKRTLTLERFEAIRGCYWVCVFWRRDEEGRPWEWLFSLAKPRPVPNRDMCWRRPTYAEAIKRQWFFDERRDDFIRFTAEAATRYAKYRP